MDDKSLSEAYLLARALGLTLAPVVVLGAAKEIVTALGVLDVLNAKVDLLVHDAVAANGQQIPFSITDSHDHCF